MKRLLEESWCSLGPKSVVVAESVVVEFVAVFVVVQQCVVGFCCQLFYRILVYKVGSFLVGTFGNDTRFVKNVVCSKNRHIVAVWDVVECSGWWWRREGGKEILQGMFLNSSVWVRCTENYQKSVLY